jgi:WD40 repeat protein
VRRLRTSAPAEAPEAAPAAPRVFISYSRRDSPFVRRLFEMLEARHVGAWVDWEGIPPSAEWWGEIQSAIQGAEAFIFVMSPDSLTSAVCQDELDHAVRHNKRLIPVLYRDGPAADGSPAAIPPALARVNWVFMRDADDFAGGSAKLCEAIETDLEWVHAHTRLVERAVEWDAAKRDPSFLLQKNDLAVAEAWLRRGPEKDPKPTTLQAEYILAGRAYAIQRRRRLLTAAGIALVLVALAGAIAGWQYLLSQARQQEAFSRRLLSQVEDLIQRDEWELGLLLGLQAHAVFPSSESLDTILLGLDHLRGVRHILAGTYSAAGPLALSDDGSLLAVAACPVASEDETCAEPVISVIRTDRGTPVATLATTTPASSAAFDGGGRRLAVSTAAGGRPSGSDGSGARGFTVRIFDLAAGLARREQAMALGAHAVEVTETGAPPDELSFVGAELLVGRSDQVFAWTSADGRLVKRLPIQAAAISGDASMALVLAEGGMAPASLEMWDIRGEGRRITTMRLPPAMSQQAVFSPDSSSIALLACQVMASGRHCNGRLSLIDRVAARVLDKQVTNESVVDPMLAVAFSRYGPWVVSGGCGADTKTEACLHGQITIWAADSAGLEAYSRPVRTFGGMVERLAFSRDGRTLVSIGSRGTVTLWKFDVTALHVTQALPSVLEARRAARPSEHRHPPPGTRPEPDGPEIRCGTEPVNDPALLAAARQLRDPQQICSANGAHSFVAAWDSGRSTLAIAGCATDDAEGTCPRGQITLWDMRDGALHKQWEGPTRTAVRRLALDLERRQIAVTMCHRDAAGKCTDSESIDVVPAGGAPGPARVLLAKVGPVSALAVSGSGETLAFATCVGFPESGPPTNQCAAGGIQLMNMRSGEVFDGMLVGHQQAVSAMAFSPGGDLLMSGAYDGSVAFWDSVERRRLGPVLIAHDQLSGVEAVDIVSDTRAVSQSESDRVEWIIGGGEWTTLACGLVTRGLTAQETRQYLGRMRSAGDPCSGQGSAGRRPWWHRFVPGLPGR